MATFTTPTNGSWYLSSTLSKATGTINGMSEARVELTLFYDHPFFTTDISVRNGVWNIYDLRSLIEQEMRNNGISYGCFTLDIDHEDDIRFNVIYCPDSINYGATTLQERQFLTTTDTSVLYPGSCVYLPFILTQREGDSFLEFDLLCTDSDGHYQHKRWSWGTDQIDDIEEYERRCELDWDTIRYHVRDLVPRVLKIEGTTDQGNIRRHIVYCVNRKPDLTLIFRNRFNAWECAPLFGELTTKTENDREIANIGDKRIFYDLHSKRTYIFDSTALTRAECNLIQDLIASHDVRIFDENIIDEPDSMEKILITENDCELTDSNNELPHVQLTFEFDNNKPRRVLERHIPYSPTQIFSTPFDDTFA